MKPKRKEEKNTNFALPSCELQVTQVINGQIIQQAIIKGSGIDKKESKELFDHALDKLGQVILCMDKEEKKKKL